LAAVADVQTKLVLELEPELRTQLRLALDPAAEPGQLPLRRGRRIWIEEALAPLRGQLPEPELGRLVHAIGATLGIEALVWLTDIAGLSRRQAVEVMRWSARSLLQATLAKHAVTASPGSGRYPGRG
jgi:hypothetical protein